MAFNREVWTAPPPPAYRKAVRGSRQAARRPHDGTNDLRSRQRFSVVTGPGVQAHGTRCLHNRFSSTPLLGESPVDYERKRRASPACYRPANERHQIFGIAIVAAAARALPPRSRCLHRRQCLAFRSARQGGQDAEAQADQLSHRLGSLQGRPFVRCAARRELGRHGLERRDLIPSGRDRCRRPTEQGFGADPGSVFSIEPDGPTTHRDCISPWRGARFQLHEIEVACP